MTNRKDLPRPDLGELLEKFRNCSEEEFEEATSDLSTGVLKPIIEEIKATTGEDPTQYSSFFLERLKRDYCRIVSNGGDYQTIFRRSLTKTLRVLDLFQRQGDSILDLGCGAGHMVYFFHLLGYQTRGVDNSPEMMDLAKGALRRKNISPEIVEQKDILTDDFNAQTSINGIKIPDFYIFYCWNYEPLVAKFLEKLSPLMKPGAFFFVPEIISRERLVCQTAQRLGIKHVFDEVYQKE